MERISVIGLGYIGLPTASLLATKGFEVLGVNVSSEVVETINRGRSTSMSPRRGSALITRPSVRARGCSTARDM